MKLLSVASEVFPLVKTGGLADVAGALPGALKGLGVEVRTLIPGYPAVMAALKDAIEVAAYGDLYGGPARLLSGTGGGLDLLVLDAPHLYNRPGSIYLGPDGTDWGDNASRFAALSFAGAEIGAGQVPAFVPDIVHVHDWQAGLVPVHLKYRNSPVAATVMTIHNIAFQGNFDPSFFPYLGLPGAAFSVGGVEYYGGISYLKGGLAMADAITTVSPTYAREIATPEFGMGLDGVIRHRGSAVSGIVNGIDTDVWNPATDSALPATFTATAQKGRTVCRSALEARFGLTGEGPILTVISRLTWQKGLDVLADAIDQLVGMGCRFAILGSGEAALESRFRGAAARHPGRVGLVIGYDEPLAHLIQAGGDAILVPSRFEPCGLTQLCALRYGAIPVVTRVGGLNDTVIDANEAALMAGVATGVQFGSIDAGGLIHAIRRLMALYSSPKDWKQMMKNALKSDVSWTRSAARYADLYASLLPNR